MIFLRNFLKIISFFSILLDFIFYDSVAPAFFCELGQIPIFFASSKGGFVKKKIFSFLAKIELKTSKKSKLPKTKY